MPYPSRGRSHNRGRGSGRRGQPRPQRETSNPTTTSSSSSTTTTPNLAALFTGLVSVLQQFISTPQGDSSSSSGGTGASGGGYPKPPQQNRRHQPSTSAPSVPSLMDFPPLARPQGMGGGTKVPRPRPQETQGRAAGINVPQQEGRSEKMSENPDFKDLVRRTNLGARLQNAKSNWQKLPSTLNAAIDRITQSIKPPAPTESLSQKLSRAAENFKSNIRHIVDEHLVTQYGSNQRALAQLDATDRDHATMIARKQLTKSNGRINNTRAEELLHIQYVDEMEIRDGWRQAQSKKRALPRTPSPQSLQISVPVEVHNRFQPLQCEDQLEPDQALELLEQTMSDPENPTQVERQKSPPTETPRKKIVVAEEAGFRVPPPPVRPALPAAAAAHPGSGLYALLRSASCSDITDATTRSTTPIPATSGRTSGQSSGNSDTTDTTTRPTTPMATTSGPSSGTSGSTSGHPPSTQPGIPSTPATPLPSPSREPRVRLSLFPPGRRDVWSIPEVRDDEDTLILTDSNGATFAEAAPCSWRIAAYRGARLEDIVNILSRFPLPAAIRTVVVMIGINDKSGFLEQPMVNSITRLHELMIVKQNLRVAVSTVPFFDGEAPGQTSQIKVLNDFLEDILRDTKWLHRLPSDFTATRKNPRDFHHYDADTASRLVRLLDSFLQSSN